MQVNLSLPSVGSIPRLGKLGYLGKLGDLGKSGKLDNNIGGPILEQTKLRLGYHTLGYVFWHFFLAPLHTLRGSVFAGLAAYYIQVGDHLRTVLISGHYRLHTVSRAEVEASMLRLKAKLLGRPVSKDHQLIPARAS